ncbi:MAG: class I SAM-dependent methyltransferase [Promethearchaeota archaeon]
MNSITLQNQNEKEVTIKDQMKKFLIKGFYGFNTVLTFGLGQRLGIFDYLYEKTKSSTAGSSLSSIIFTIEEISEKLNLNLKYIDAWVHLGLVCGLFEINDAIKKEIKTAPHVYSLLIDCNHMFYVGDTIGAFYYLAPYQDSIFEYIKGRKQLGTKEFYNEYPEDVIRATQRMSARVGSLVERLFSKNFKDFCRSLTSDSSILSVGCGYGYTLAMWAKKYKKAQFVGIDIDSRGTLAAQKLIEENNMSDRVEILEIPLDKYTKQSEKKFNLILLNQVLHEMEKDKAYRFNVFNDLYVLLKDGGILLVGESMIHDTFDWQQEFQLFDVMHKFLEADFAGFYDEITFKEFINSTPFKDYEFIKDKGTYFWVLRK